MSNTFAICLNSACSNWLGDMSMMGVKNHCKLFRDVTQCPEVKLPMDKYTVSCACNCVGVPESVEPPKPEYKFDESVFASPQTGSKYRVVNSSDTLFVAYRYLGDNRYRVRMQGPAELLEIATKALEWSYVKSGDHISTVVSDDILADTLGAATAVMQKIISENK